MKEKNIVIKPQVAEDLGAPQNRQPIQASLKSPPRSLNPPNSNTDISTSIRINDLEKQVAYYKDLLQRHQDLLAVYQSKYHIIPDHEIEERRRNEKSITPPWIFNSEYMTPLLAAYDQRVFDMEQEAEAARARFEAMRLDVKRVVEENNHLQEQLRIEMEKKLKESTRVAYGHTSDSEEYLDLVEKNKLMQVENESLDKERDALQQEVERMKRALEDYNSRLESVTEFEERSKQVLQNARQKIRVAQEDRDDMKAQLLAAERRIHQLSKQLAQANAKIATAGETDEGLIRKKELEVSVLEDQLQMCRNEIDILTREKQVLLRQNGEAEERVARHQQHEFVALQRVKELTDQLESATLELSTLRSSESSKRNEIQNLEQKIQQLQRENTDKERIVKEELQSLFNAERIRLNDDINKARVSLLQLEEKLSRTEREKQHAEQEVQRIIRAAESEHITPPKLISDLTRKLAIACNERDEAERMYEQLRNSSKQHHTQWEQEKDHLFSQSQQYQKRMQFAERELERITDELEQVKRDLAVSQRHVQELTYEKEENERQQQNRINDLNQDHSRQISESTRKLLHTQERLELAEKELEALKLKLEKQEVSLKAELRADLDASEQKYHDLKNSSTLLREELQALEGKYSQLQREKMLLQSDKETFEENEKKLHIQLKQIKKRADANASQVKSLLDREAELLKEKTNTQLNADRMELEVERLKRERDSLKKKLNELRTDYDHVLELQHVFGNSNSHTAAQNETDLSVSWLPRNEISSI